MADFFERVKNPASIVSGVAAAIAHKFEWSCLWTRVVCAVGIFCNPALGLIIYFVLALVLPKWKKPC
ncbi:PspC domain-containing protein [Shewanella youngdeokensis]|uniref:PspC domain-containing protein n=1 Tax=Shewanella youngdeokensis TaxID=2999068 RepID=A0ABZ0JWK1_9GAMM|nr:PspC domain-containing protein [Shewanella sp. DAU334]